MYPCSSHLAAEDSGWLASRFELAGLAILFEPATERAQERDYNEG